VTPKNEKEKEASSNTSGVGYRKPPVESQFKPGKSGNPKGRRKGSLNFQATLLRTLQETVIINENGKRKQVTKLEAALKQLLNKAASGDLRALMLLTTLVRPLEQRLTDEQLPNEEIAEADETILRKILQRYEQESGEDNDAQGLQ
jgi:hypothetical protein